MEQATWLVPLVFCNLDQGFQEIIRVDYRGEAELR
jgi:hypothetical protein